MKNNERERESMHSKTIGRKKRERERERENASPVYI
jgi:hypothetical protein